MLRIMLTSVQWIGSIHLILQDRHINRMNTISMHTIKSHVPDKEGVFRKNIKCATHRQITSNPIRKLSHNP